MKCSYFWVAVFCVLLSVEWCEGVALPANPKRKSKNLLSDNSENVQDHQSDLIPIPDNLLKKPQPKKVVHGMTTYNFKYKTFPDKKGIEFKANIFFFPPKMPILKSDFFFPCDT